MNAIERTHTRRNTLNIGTEISRLPLAAAVAVAVAAAVAASSFDTNLFVTHLSILSSTFRFSSFSFSLRSSFRLNEIMILYTCLCSCFKN